MAGQQIRWQHIQIAGITIMVLKKLIKKYEYINFVVFIQNIKMGDYIEIEWKPFPHKELKKLYELSNLGLVRSVLTQKIIKRGIRSGYISVTLNVNKKSRSFKIHRRVAKAFIENDDPENKTWVNHINGDKLDCIVSNLEWTTPTGNAQHAIDNGLTTKTKKAVVQYDLKTGKKIKKYESVLEASKATDISDGSICNACSGKKKHAGGYGWKYVDENPNNQSDVDLSEYKQIDGFPNYVLDKNGNIYSLPYKRFLKFQTNSEGCQCIQLTNIDKKKDFLVHRLVAMYFLKKKDKKANSVRHKDGDKTNNHLDNLEWCYVGGVEMPKTKYNTLFYNPKTAIKPVKKKSIKSKPKDLLTANPRNLSNKQREERRKLLEKKISGSKTSKPKIKSGSKTSNKKKVSKTKSKELN